MSRPRIRHLVLEQRAARLRAELAEVEALLAASPRTPRGRKRQVVLSPDDQRFVGMAQAARHEGVTVGAIHKRIKRGGTGWRWAKTAEAEGVR